MSRYVESTGPFLYRAPISVDLTGGGGTVDVSCPISAQWPEFWDRILSSGNDIRVTAPDGVTLATYDLQGFVYATKTLTIEVDNINLTTAGSNMALLWLYWGNASAADAKTVFAPASAKSGYVAIEAPPAQYFVVVTPERQAQTKAAAVMVKKVSEIVDIYFDFSACLRPRPTAYGGSRAYEEIISISLQDVQLAAASQAVTMLNSTSARFCGEGMARIQVKAGTNATTYVVICQVTTSLGNVYEGRARLFVQNTSEA